MSSVTGGGYITDVIISLYRSRRSYIAYRNVIQFKST